VVEGDSKAEIDELHVSVTVQHDVVELNVVVNDTEYMDRVDSEYLLSRLVRDGDHGADAY
jgi:hypothetical protein